MSNVKEAYESAFGPMEDYLVYPNAVINSIADDDSRFPFPEYVSGMRGTKIFLVTGPFPLTSNEVLGYE